MTTVRELTIRLGTTFDGAGFKQADSAMSGLTRTATSLAGIVGGIFAGRGLFNMAEEYTRFEDMKRIMEQSGQTLDDLRQKSGGLFSDKDLVENFNRANKFGLGGAFPEMLKIADASAKLLGESQQYMLQRLTTGLAKGSAQRLDELGILVSKSGKGDGKAASKFQKELLDEIGLEPNELAKLRKEALKQGLSTVELVNQVGATNSDLYDQLPNQLQTVRLAMGRLSDIVIRKAAPALAKLSTWFEKMSQSGRLDSAMTSIGNAFEQLVSVLGAAAYVGMKTIEVLDGLGLAALPFVSLIAALSPISGTAIVGIALMTIALENLYGEFSPEKVGFLEKYRGKWDELAMTMANAPYTGAWSGFFKFMYMQFAQLASGFETAIDVFVEGKNVLNAVMFGDAGARDAAYSRFKEVVGNNYDDARTNAAFIDAREAHQMSYGAPGSYQAAAQGAGNTATVHVYANSADATEVAARVEEKLAAMMEFTAEDNSPVAPE